MRKANLSEVYLGGADLRWADLTRANMNEVKLSYANLKRVKGLGKEKEISPRCLSG